MNINHPSQTRLCTSCQICGAVCPTSAISIELNEDGFYRPKVELAKCVDCSLCTKSCYKFDNSVKPTADFDNKILYAAWAKDKQVVKSTTSGGIADLLAKKLISQGYKCIGVKYDPTSNRAVGVTAENEKETEAFKGSKYIQSYSIDAFKEFVRNNKSNRYAIFGLPCQIYAINKYLVSKGERNRHILIDLYCHGCPSLNLWQKYTNELLDKHNCTKIISANFRSKMRGWGIYNMSLSLSSEKNKYNVDVLSPRTNDYFYDLFFSDIILNDSCCDCSLRSTLEYTDIRLGDFWGKSFVMNHTGVSGVTLCTDTAKKLFTEIKNEIEFTQEKFCNFLPYQSYGKSYKISTKTRQIILKQLADKSIALSESISTYKKSLSLKNRTVIKLKNIAKILPNNIVSLIRAVIYILHK